MASSVEPKRRIWVGPSEYFVDSIGAAFDAARMRFQPLTFVRIEIDLRASGLRDSLGATEHWIERIACAGDTIGSLSEGRLGMLAIGRTMEQMRFDLEALWEEAIAEPGKAARMPTLSFGIAGVEGFGDAVESMMERAEAALRFGRRTGGWKVVSAFRSGAMVVSDFQALMLEGAVWRLENAEDGRAARVKPVTAVAGIGLSAD
ncbi:hypothetical protein [Zavarzinia aquatilis]|uniref:GGDEF domain-containing protein n=1 Tax=Zavarzinia aquatilis TaxID=2211142 RepID=A0A317E590_9PROT|nr:hypothetical protein [Zavarzinia aquatilis]PWR21336.1 hypothetical protein DKG74_12895 [Zavarzinia aquatilis]